MFLKCKILAYKLGKDFKLTINLSEYQLRNEDIVTFIREEFDKNKLDPRFIEFEITESVVMKSAEKILKLLLFSKLVSFESIVEQNNKDLLNK